MDSTLDPREMENYVENILAENLTLKRKLESKIEAVTILNRELAACVMEKNQYKALAEELQEKNIVLRKAIMLKESLPPPRDEHLICSHDPRDKNRHLACEVDTLRQRLRDALGDIQTLRTTGNNQRSAAGTSEAAAVQLSREEEMVKQLEEMNQKISQLEKDLQGAMDEKEELIAERDTYKCKIHRLNLEFNNLLKGENRNLIDIDSLIMENRHLQENLIQAQEEVKVANHTINTYKALFNKKRGLLPLRPGFDNLSEVLLCQEQVKNMIQILSADLLPPTPGSIKDLRSMCVALLESLNDKTLALLHQRKTCRILAARIAELEKQMGENSRLLHPSQILLEGYGDPGAEEQEQGQPPQENAQVEGEENNAAEASNTNETEVQQTEVESTAEAVETENVNQTETEQHVNETETEEHVNETEIEQHVNETEEIEPIEEFEIEK